MTYRRLLKRSIIALAFTGTALVTCLGIFGQTIFTIAKGQEAKAYGLSFLLTLARRNCPAGYLLLAQKTRDQIGYPEFCSFVYGNKSFKEETIPLVGGFELSRDNIRILALSNPTPVWSIDGYWPTANGKAYKLQLTLIYTGNYSVKDFSFSKEETYFATGDYVFKNQDREEADKIINSIEEALHESKTGSITYRGATISFIREIDSEFENNIITTINDIKTMKTGNVPNFLQESVLAEALIKENVEIKLLGSIQANHENGGEEITIIQLYVHSHNTMTPIAMIANGSKNKLNRYAFYRSDFTEKNMYWIF